MSEINTLSQSLRNYTMDMELPMQLGPILTTNMLKTSDLHADFGNKAEEYGVPAFLQQETYTAMKGEAAELAAEAAAFLQGHAKTLIHDGLSAEHIVLTEDEPQITYPEDVFRGPFGYDVASLMVSGLLAWCRGYALIEDEFERDDFCDCCLDLISNLADQLVWNYDCLFEELADAEKTKEPEFKRTYFEGMMPDLAAATGLEVLRVLLGQRSEEDLKEVQDPEKKEQAEKILLHFAKTCISVRNSFYFGADFAAAVERAAREA